ncbi:MAG: cytochrome c [Gammaproteobacteria bacterium]|nr:cytochrome c [Gammaproteobacteria bacterium]
MQRLWIAVLAALLGVPAMAAGAAGDVAAGERLFAARCALCHVGFAPGTIMLGRRLGPERAVLAERSDLTGDYVRHVVRHGLLSMPPFTRVDLNDAELAQVIAYLTRPRSPVAPAGAP